MKKEVYGAKLVVALVFFFSVFILLLIPLASSAPPPRVCGDDQCQDPETCTSCPEDCGVCPAEEPTTTTSGEAGGGPEPITVSIESPEDGETIKRGTLPIVVEGFRGTFHESDIKMTATSDLFGKLELIDNFEKRGSGIYGANFTVSKETTAGNYVILVRGQLSNVFDEHQILITLNPTITIDTSIKDAYFKGERIFFEGSTKYFDGSLVKNASLYISLFAPGGYFFNLSASTDQNGRFAVSYPISFAEQEGNWDIKITAKDENGNEGTRILKTKVSTPKGVVFYTVNFFSPFKDSEFKRGDTVPVTVEVKDEGRLLEGAKVEFKDPSGSFVPLKEIRPGIYSAEYRIKMNDPLGVWNIPAQALKVVDGATKAGGTLNSVTILPASLNLFLLEPTNFDFSIGQRITLRAKTSYADGSPVEKAKVRVKFGSKTITLSEKDPGVYEERYLLREEEDAAATLELFAEDVYGNSVSVPQRAITVESVSKPEYLLRLFYYNIIVRYWYLFVMVIIILIIGTEPLWHPIYLQKRLKSLHKAENRNIETQKDIQRKYFKHHSISRDDYQKLISKYREDISSIKEKKLKFKERLEKKRFSWKRIVRGKK